MKSIRILITAGLTLCPPFLTAQFAQAAPNPPTISVAGQAEIKVAPDLIDLRLGVETRAKDLATARADHGKRVDAVLAAIRKQGVEEKDIQTDWLGISPGYESHVKVQPDVYTLQKTIQCTIRDMKAFETVLTAALDAGVTHVHGIDFRTTRLREFRDKARLNALRAAREKADLLAGELGMKRGRAQSVAENQWGGIGSWSSGSWGRSYGGGMVQNSMNSFQDAGAGSVDGGLAAGQISISAMVNVSFLLE